MPSKSRIHKPVFLHSVRWFIASLVLLFGYADLFGGEPAVIKRWEFHSADDMACWQNAYDLKDVSVANHRLRMTITGPTGLPVFPWWTTLPATPPMPAES